MCDVFKEYISDLAFKGLVGICDIRLAVKMRIRKAVYFPRAVIYGGKLYIVLIFSVDGNDNARSVARGDRHGRSVI